MTKMSPTWANLCIKVQRYFIQDFPGKDFMKFAWAVNLHKIFTLFIIVGMMFHYDNFSTGAWVYLGLHGIYGYCWLIKDLGFRDHRLEEVLSIGGVFNLYAILIAWYWVIPWLFISRYVEPSNIDLFIAVALHTLGVVLMVAADGQRHFTLKYKKGLITTGLCKYTRNPNYLGEIMLYAAFAFLADHWAAWAILAYATVTTFIPNMYAKDQSLSRYPQWQEYEESSSFLIPWALINGKALRREWAESKDSELFEKSS